MRFAAPLKLTRLPEVYPPLGLCAHAVQAPVGTELISLSRQFGVDANSMTSGDLAEQADLIFANTIAWPCSFLPGRGVVKLTTLMIGEIYRSQAHKARLKHLDEHRPASTATNVSQLIDPAWLVEVEAVAAKP